MSILTPEVARRNNADPNSAVRLPELDGALVLAVAPESPAASAGARKFDLIRELAGQTIRTSAHLAPESAPLAPIRALYTIAASSCQCVSFPIPHGARRTACVT